MIKTVSILLVDAKRLHEAPRQFQDYVRKYFLETEIEGKIFFHAFRVMEINPKQGKGVAPVLDLDLIEFRISPSMSLGTWISQNMNRQGGFIQMLRGVWETGDYVLV